MKHNPRSGRPVKTVTLENVAAAEKLVNEDRRIGYRQIQELLQISALSFYDILHKRLEVRKVCSLWLPHLLTDKQKHNRMEWSKKMLKRFESGTSKDVGSIIAGDMTWLYYYDVLRKS